MNYSDLFREVLKVKYNNDSATNEMWSSVNDDQLNQMIVEIGSSSVENANRLRKIAAVLEYLGDNTKGIAKRGWDQVNSSIKIRVDPIIIIERLKNMKIEQMEQEDAELFSIISKKKSDERRDELSKFGKLVSNMKRQFENEREQFFRERELKDWKRAEKEKGIREFRKHNKKEREIDLEKRRSSVNVKEIIKLLNRDPNNTRIYIINDLKMYMHTLKYFDKYKLIIESNGTFFINMDLLVALTAYMIHTKIKLDEQNQKITVNRNGIEYRRL